MATVKTAISVGAGLFKEADAMARRLRVPRSRVFVMALEDFLERHRNRQLLDRINKAYAKGLDAEERRLLARMKSYERDRIKDEW
jgi:metal-responsive CopG/Arc/MetJ family transcriptional regulator